MRLLLSGIAVVALAAVVQPAQAGVVGRRGGRLVHF